MKRSEVFFSLLQIPIDFLMVLIAGLIAYFLRTSQWVSSWRPVMFDLPFTEYVTFLLEIAVISVGFFALSGLYQLKITRSLIHELLLVILSATAGVVALALWLFLTANPFESRFIVLFWWIFAIVFVSSARIALKKVQQHLAIRYNIGVHNVILIGHSNPGRSKEFLRALKKNPGLGFRVVGEMLAIDMAALRKIMEAHDIDDVFLTDLSWNEKKILALAEFCHRMQLNFSFIPSIFTSFRTSLRSFPSGLVLLEVRHTPLEGWGRILKRGVDIAGSLVGLFIVAMMFPFVALAIKLDSSGPVIIGLRRVREGGKTFTLYKFRSMQQDAQTLKWTLLKKKNERRFSPLFKMRSDPRITRVGRFLRRYRLDEFPNFYNVLKGDMSLVGPRPHEPQEVARYQKHHLRVLSIKPGVTGLAQISGSSDLPFDREVELDSYYIENWSLAFDFHIILRTIFFIFRDKSAV